MDLTAILQDLRSERDRLNQAIAALERVSSPQAAKRSPVIAGRRLRKSRFSAEARRRMSEAQKRRRAREKKTIQK
jgi:hypothetical protein